MHYKAEDLDAAGVHVHFNVLNAPESHDPPELVDLSVHTGVNQQGRQEVNARLPHSV